MIILALGSNLGNRQANLDLAIAMLKAKLIDNVKKSSVIETAPLLPTNPEQGWEQLNFLNMCISGKLKKPMQPEDILEITKSIETEVGRKPAAKWAPRIIDIDIIAIDDLVYSSPTLTIPHKEALKRDFVMKPLQEICPDWNHL